VIHNEYLETETNADKLISTQEKLKTENKKTILDLNILANKYEKLQGEFTRIKDQNDKRNTLTHESLEDQTFQCLSMNQLNQFTKDINHCSHELFTYYPVKQNVHALTIKNNKVWMGYEQDLLNDIENLDKFLKDDDLIAQDNGAIEALFEKIENKSKVFNFDDHQYQYYRSEPHQLLKVFEDNGITTKKFETRDCFEISIDTVTSILRELVVSYSKEDPQWPEDDFLIGLCYWNDWLSLNGPKDKPDRTLAVVGAIEGLGLGGPVFKLDVLLGLFEKLVKGFTMDGQPELSNFFFKGLMTTIYSVVRESEIHNEKMASLGGDQNMLGIFYDNFVNLGEGWEQECENYSEIFVLVLMVISEFNAKGHSLPEGEVLGRIINFCQSQFAISGSGSTGLVGACLMF
jgi:hypothetical protein